MPQITMYTTAPCAFCTAAKGLLEKRGLEFEEIYLDKNSAGRAELVERTGMMTFPQILIDGALVGGFAELYAADRSGRLEALVGGS
jgi:glutaredoxin 3